ncbi:MAG: ATP-binding protein [Microscillaceae bacterium]|nr:ATP-binding protein [Microscillaceae bacterium]
MNDNTINLNELASRESQTIEWKENVADVSKVIETIVAFANDFLNLGGGYVICGAKEIKNENGFPKVEYIGLTPQRLKEVRDEVSNTCYNPTKVNPPIIPKIDEIDIPGDNSRKVLMFTVDATGNAHTFKTGKGENYKPTYFVRTDSSTRGATNGIQRELLRRKGQLDPWDRRINQKASITDIDQISLRQYLQDMRIWNPNKTIDQYLSAREKIEEFIPPLMGQLGIDKPLYPKNFTILIFGKDQSLCSDGAYSIFATFRGEDKSQPMGEVQWIKGTIVAQTKKLIELLNIESTIAVDKDSPDRPNQIKYPTTALKEAVVNALVHRDYEIDQPTRITVFSNRVEIYSPGGLPFNVNEEKFKKGEATASWRNQSLGRIFSLLQLAQHLGSGIPRIIKSMEEEGCPPPIFEVEHDSITCILPAHPRHQMIKKISEIESDIVIKNYQPAFKKVTQILEEDVHNYKALELYADINKILETPTKVLDFIKSQDIDYEQIRPVTLITISETLSLIENNKEATELSELLLKKALRGRLEEKQLVKVAFTLKKLGDNKAVIDFVTNTISDYPTLKTSTNLLQQRARAAIDLAKICKEQISNTKIKYPLKEKAKQDMRRYLDLAEKDLNLALENVQSLAEQEWLSRDLEYLKTDMKPLLDEKRMSIEDKRKLYITGFKEEITENQLQKYFEKFGEIINLKIKISKTTNKRYAIVEFKDSQSANKAFIERSELNLYGSKLFVEKYKRKHTK